MKVIRGAKMADLEKAFREVYSKFKMHFYKGVFKKNKGEGVPLTTVEIFCMEGIAALKEPTIAEFSLFMNISTPNAAYKVNNLVEKGYLEKIQSKKDRREYFLRPTKKYWEFESVSYSYLSEIVERAKKNFPKEDLDKLTEMLSRIASELMPEIKI